MPEVTEERAAEAARTLIEWIQQRAAQLATQKSGFRQAVNRYVQRPGREGDTLIDEALGARGVELRQWALMEGLKRYLSAAVAMGNCMTSRDEFPIVCQWFLLSPPRPPPPTKPPARRAPRKAAASSGATRGRGGR